MNRSELIQALGDMPLHEIRALLGDLERAHGVDLTPDRREDTLRAAPAYGGPPPPLRLYGAGGPSDPNAGPFGLYVVGVASMMPAAKAVMGLWKGRSLGDTLQGLRGASPVSPMHLQGYEGDRRTADADAAALRAQGVTVEVRVL